MQEILKWKHGSSVLGNHRGGVVTPPWTCLNVVVTDLCNQHSQKKRKYNTGEVELFSG